MAIAEIIKYEGDNSTFIWKHPCEDFNTSSQLIVHESQEAIFFMNGQALDLFGPGRHTLETENIPLLRKFTNIPTGGKTPFHCEVYFINRTEQMAIKWGTDSKIQYIEPTYKFPLAIGASGEMSLSVADSRKLLINLVGTERVLDRNQLVTFFRAFLMTKVKTYIAQEMRTQAINIFEIDEKLEEFSAAIKKRLDNDFLDYGVNLKRFLVTVIVKPDGNPQYEKFKELHFRQYADIAEARLKQQTDVIYAQTEAQKVVIDSQAQATKRAQEGYTYQQERGFDVAQDVAQNEAVGQFTNMGVTFIMEDGKQIGKESDDKFEVSARIVINKSSLLKVIKLLKNPPIENDYSEDILNAIKNGNCTKRKIMNELGIDEYTYEKYIQSLKFKKRIEFTHRRWAII